MNLQLEGKVALVLCASGGLGSAVAKALAAEGARVAAMARNAAAAEALVAELESAGGTAMAVSWDLADLSAIDSSVALIEDRLGPVDILVNITGGPPPSPAAGQDPETWAKFFNSMVLSVFAITDRVLPGMRERKWGRVITCTSSGMIAPIPNLGMSNSLRMALLGWSKTLAREVGGDGVTTNIVVPGRIATARVAQLDAARAKREGRTVAQVETASKAAIPAGRYGKPEEFAACVTFLAGEPAAFVTGSVMRVDGGQVPSV